MLLALCWGVTHLYAGRGAYMQIGAMLGTIMAGNVLFLIIPSQKQLVAAKLRVSSRTRDWARAPSNARCTTITSRCRWSLR